MRIKYGCEICWTGKEIILAEIKVGGSMTILFVSSRINNSL